MTAHCQTCTCQSKGANYLFGTTRDGGAGRLASAQTFFTFADVNRADRQGEALRVSISGETDPVWLYGDDRERFLREWRHYAEVTS